MEIIDSIFKDLFKQSTAADLLNDEYIGTDGIIFCKKCNTPRQIAVDTDCGKRYFRVGCQCMLEKDEIEQEEFKKEKRERIREKSIPIASYRNYRFENDDGKSPETTKLAKNYVDNFETLAKTGQGLLLYGGVGTGKTFLAMCIANALIDRGYNVYQTTLSQVVQMARDWDNANYILKGLCKSNVSFLMI